MQSPCAEYHTTVGEGVHDRLPLGSRRGETAPPQSQDAGVNAVHGGWLEEVAASEVISMIVMDWFEHIYPICPILHRRRFLARLRRGDADADATFCALVILVCATGIKILRRDEYGPVTVAQCLDIVERHGLLRRGGAPRASYSLEWCTAMYLFSATRTALFRLKVGDAASFSALADSAAGVRYLVHYGMESLDQTQRELLRRVFWMHFFMSW